MLQVHHITQIMQIHQILSNYVSSGIYNYIQNTCFLFEIPKYDRCGESLKCFHHESVIDKQQKVLAKYEQ